MDDKRLLQEQARSRTRSHRVAGKDWKAVKDREEELRAVAPLFQQMEGIHPPSPNPQEWRTLSQVVANRLANSKTPLMPTLKDKLTATDSELARWFWIIIALMVIITLTATIALTLNAPPPVSYDAALSSHNPSTVYRLATASKPNLLNAVDPS